MKPFLPILFLCFFSYFSHVNAQNPGFQWAATQSLNLPSTAFNKTPQYVIAADPSGGAVSCGLSAWTKNYGSLSYGNMQMLHYDALGNTTWTRHFPGNALAFQIRYTHSKKILMLGQYIDSVRLSATTILQ